MCNMRVLFLHYQTVRYYTHTRINETSLLLELHISTYDSILFKFSNVMSQLLQQDQ